MAGTVRIVIGVFLIIIGIFGLFLFFIGLIPIVLGALLIWSGRGAQRQEEMNRTLQQQQAQLAYMQQTRTAPPPYPSPGFPGLPTGPVGAPCPRCGGPTTWIAQYSRWYCTNERLYL